MSQHLSVPKAVSASTRSRFPSRYVHLGFRFARYRCAPWFVLASASLKLLFATGVERIPERVRYFKALARIDFVGLYGLLDDLLQ